MKFYERLIMPLIMSVALAMIAPLMRLHPEWFGGHGEVVGLGVLLFWTGLAPVVMVAVWMVKRLNNYHHTESPPDPSGPILIFLGLGLAPWLWSVYWLFAAAAS